MEDVNAFVEIGEDNTTATIVDYRTTIRTTFEQRNSAEQAKLATMIWNIGVESILNAASQSMLLMLHTGRRPMKGGLFGRPHEHTQQPCKRLLKTHSSCARSVHSAQLSQRTIVGAP